MTDEANVHLYAMVDQLIEGTTVCILQTFKYGQYSQEDFLMKSDITGDPISFDVGRIL